MRKKSCPVFLGNMISSSVRIRDKQYCQIWHFNDFGLTSTTALPKKRTVNNSIVDKILADAPAVQELKNTLQIFAILVRAWNMLYSSTFVQLIKFLANVNQNVFV